MSKNPQKTGKQPYIPLYIGDWEQDTNMLSLEAEGGWLKVIFKMFKNGKNGVYKISTKGLQNLWRKSSPEIAEIIKELKDAEVCIVDTYEDGFVFINRRMQREYDISQKRSKAVQTRYKQDSNRVQPLEYEYEYSKDSSIVQVDACKNRETENVRGKPIPELAIASIRGLGEIQIKTLPTENAWELTELREMITNSEHQFQSIASTKKPMNNVLNFQAILQSFVDMIQSSGQYQTSAELRKYFTNWIGKKNGTLEKFVEELKEDKPKTKNKNSFV